MRLMIQRVCKSSMPIRRTKKVGVRWWTQELTGLKREAYRARKRHKKKRMRKVEKL